MMIQQIQININQFEYTLNAFWIHFAHTLNPLWIHFDRTLNPLWSHFDPTLNPRWIHFECILNPLWSHFESTLNKLWMHFEYADCTKFMFYFLPFNLNQKSTFERKNSQNQPILWLKFWKLQEMIWLSCRLRIIKDWGDFENFWTQQKFISRTLLFFCTTSNEILQTRQCRSPIMCQNCNPTLKENLQNCCLGCPFSAGQFFWFFSFKGKRS